MELELTPAFPTLIGQLRVPDPEVMNRDLQALILAEEAQYSSLGRSNVGGRRARSGAQQRRRLALASRLPEQAGSRSVFL